MNSLIKVDDLHDAVLKGIAIDVASACVTIELGPVQRDGGSDGIRLVARGFEHLAVPRKQPWGFVNVWYVNEVRGPFTLGTTLRLEIEMQSGDVLEIHASMFERHKLERHAG